jgi:hypothetical protein
MEPAHAFTLFDRTVARPRPWWATLLLIVLVYLPTVAAAFLLGLADLSGEPRTRSLLAAPTIIAYVLLLGPLMSRLGPAVVRSLRPILLVEDAELKRIVEGAWFVPLWHELAAIAGGMALGLLIIGPAPAPGDSWPIYFVMATGYVMLGLLAWAGYLSIAGTRLVSTLLRLPMRVDPLDRKPFEAIGRQSLAMALAFVGGITIGLLLGGYGAGALLNPRFWLLFLPLSLLPVLVFYLNMRPTHRVLSTARERALDQVQQQMRRSFPSLLEHMQKGEPTGNLSWEVNALVAYEKELQEASTWPYNPAILRTLVVSVLVPTATLLTRRVVEVFIR